MESARIAFSHEVLGLLPDLSQHAEQMKKVLEPGGCYYTSFSWHTDNPYLQNHINHRHSRGLSFYEYGLEEVADAFHRAGFEVGVKRIKVPYFLMYDPKITGKRFGNIATMIRCLEDHAVVFSMRLAGDRL